MMGEALSNREVHEEKEVALSISSSVVRFDDLSRQVVDCAYKVHQYFGAGLMEKIYEEALCKELFKRQIPFKRQVSFPVSYEGELLDARLQLDLVIDDKIILELKTVEKITPVFEAQILTYMKISRIETGFIINFKEPYFKNAIKRFALTSKTS